MLFGSFGMVAERVADSWPTWLMPRDAFGLDGVVASRAANEARGRRSITPVRRIGSMKEAVTHALPHRLRERLGQHVQPRLAGHRYQGVDADHHPDVIGCTVVGGPADATFC